MSWKCEYEVLEITSDKKVSRSELKTSDLTRLLYHIWFPKPHIHISIIAVLASLKNICKQGKIDSRKFQHLFDLEFRETSNIFSTFKKPIEKIKIKVFYILLYELKFHKVSQNWKSNRFIKFQLFNLKNEKIYF